MGWLAFGIVLYQDCLGSCRKCLSNPEFMGIRSTLYHNYPDEIGTRPAEIATVWQRVDAALQAQLAAPQEGAAIMAGDRRKGCATR